METDFVQCFHDAMMRRMVWLFYGSFMLLRARISMPSATMTSSPCAAAAAASSTSTSLATAVADALEDIGLKRLVVGAASGGGPSSSAPSEQDIDTSSDGHGHGQHDNPEKEAEQEAEQASSQSEVWRAYRDDRGGMSLTVARSLLSMALSGQEMRSLLRNGAVVGRAGIMTWEDLEAVCRELGCPTCGMCTNGEEGEENGADDDANDDANDDNAKTRRKLELTLFLATEVECRRLLRKEDVDTEQLAAAPSSPPPPTSTSSAATPNANFLQKLIEASPPGRELSDDQLRSILAESTDVTSDQMDRIVERNRALQADYSLREQMVRQKFDATAIAMAGSGLHTCTTKGGTDTDENTKVEDASAVQEGGEGETEPDPVEMEIRKIASGMANMDLSVSAADGTNADDSGDDVLHQFLLPSTHFAPATQKQVMKSDIDMPAWQKTRQWGPPPRTPGGGKSPVGGRNKKKKTPKKIPKKDQETETEIADVDVDVVVDVGAKPAEVKDANKVESPPEVELPAEAPGSTPKSAKKRRGGRGKSKGDASRAAPESKQDEPKDADGSVASTPVKASPESKGAENTKDVAETPAANSSAKKRSRRRRPKKSGEATPDGGDKQKPKVDADAQDVPGHTSEVPQHQTQNEDGDGGKKRNRRRRNTRNRGRGKPGEKPSEEAGKQGG